MKIIDLLNMIANGEEFPDVVKFYNDYFTWDSDYKDWRNEDNSKGLLEYNVPYTLNNELEIIEEDNNKIEKLNIDAFSSLECRAIGRRVNQIINKINDK